MLIRITLAALALLLASDSAAAEEIQVAVASNFAGVAESLASRFQERSGHQVILISGATGKHYAQIRNGAPFDILLAADRQRPAALEDDGLAVIGSRFTYARGQLVLWSPLATRVDQEGRVLGAGDFRFLAIANPDLAPYGRAAREVLAGLGLDESLQGRLVRGENIGQTFQFVASGNAELGFVALSQILDGNGHERPGSSWRVPQELYTPIEQQAVLLRDGRVARDFMTFTASDEGQAIIQSYGYETP